MYRLPRDVSAWNVDGSSGHKPPPPSRSFITTTKNNGKGKTNRSTSSSSYSSSSSSSSWIQYWEQQTGLSRSEQSCAYVDCRSQQNKDPEQRQLHGGHVWIARSSGEKSGHSVIVPICNSCNYWANPYRMQNSGSRLRKGVTVVKIEMTAEMKLADRRIATIIDDDDDDGGGGYRTTWRNCTDCGHEISNQSETHTQCTECYRRGKSLSSFHSSIMNNDTHEFYSTIIPRRCLDCAQDIGDQPESHTQCLDCYRGASQRNCQDCGKSIDDRPKSHTQCWDCYWGSTRSQSRQTKQQRHCQDCGQDICHRPETHTVCLPCYHQRRSGSATTKTRTTTAAAVVAATRTTSTGRPKTQPTTRHSRRLCKDCGSDISERPKNHSKCLECFRDSQY